jgi:hypothetical protein
VVIRSADESGLVAVAEGDVANRWQSKASRSDTHLGLSQKRILEREVGRSPPNLIHLHEVTNPYERPPSLRGFCDSLTSAVTRHE